MTSSLLPVTIVEEITFSLGEKEVRAMMDYNFMMGGSGGTMMFFAWTIYVLIVILLVLGIIALWKYINKK